MEVIPFNKNKLVSLSVNIFSSRFIPVHYKRKQARVLVHKALSVSF